MHAQSKRTKHQTQKRGADLLCLTIFALLVLLILAHLIAEPKYCLSAVSMLTRVAQIVATETSTCNR